MGCKQDKLWIEIVLKKLSCSPKQSTFLGEQSPKPALGSYDGPDQGFMLVHRVLSDPQIPLLGFELGILLFLSLFWLSGLTSGLLRDTVFLHQAAQVYSFFELST